MTCCRCLANVLFFCMTVGILFGIPKLWIAVLPDMLPRSAVIQKKVSWNSINVDCTIYLMGAGSAFPILTCRSRWWISTANDSYSTCSWSFCWTLPFPRQQSYLPHAAPQLGLLAPRSPCMAKSPTVVRTSIVREHVDAVTINWFSTSRLMILKGRCVEYQKFYRPSYAIDVHR